MTWISNDRGNSYSGFEQVGKSVKQRPVIDEMPPAMIVCVDHDRIIGNITSLKRVEDAADAVIHALHMRTTSSRDASLTSHPLSHSDAGSPGGW